MTQQQWGYPQQPQRATWPAPQGAPWPNQQGWQQPNQAAPWPNQGWQQPTPPKRRSSGLATVLKVALTIAVILFAASILRGLVSGVLSAGGTAGGTSGGSSTSAPLDPGAPAAQYVNEDYSPPPADMNPPAIPGPRTLDAANSLTTANPVYGQSIPVPTNCSMASLDMSKASAAQMQTHFNELMGCLMTVYALPVSQAGFQMPRPPVIVYSSPIKTACGDFDDVNAAYCSGDQRVYYARPLLQAFPAAVAQADYAAEMILAHEFGHAIQARTAILISEKVLEDRASSEEAAMVLSRRTEVQADCLAGQYIRSAAQSQSLDAADLAALGRLAYNLGDDVLTGRAGYSGDHGTGEARQRWFERGLSSNSIGACNSFTAAASQVR